MTREQKEKQPMWQKCHLCPKYSQLQVWKRGLQGCGWVSPQRRKQVCSEVCVSISMAVASKGAVTSGGPRLRFLCQAAMRVCQKGPLRMEGRNIVLKACCLRPRVQSGKYNMHSRLGRLGTGGEALAHRATERNLVTLRSQAWPPPSSTVCPQVSLLAIFSPCLVESRQPDSPDLTAA